MTLKELVAMPEKHSEYKKFGAREGNLLTINFGSAGTEVNFQ